MTEDLAGVARRALALLDLTDLNEDCTPEDVDRLCAAAVTPHGSVAAVCVWPRFARQCVERLAGGGVRVAAVANFPEGRPEVGPVVEEIQRIFAEGADEADVVIPWRALAAGDEKPVTRLLAAARRATPPGGGLKAILETGALAEPKLIRRAAELALAQDVDFLKTSTGKTPVGATEAAAEILLGEIRRSGKPSGFKASGGVRATEDAARYLAMADRIMGPGWADPERFRFGASGLLRDLLARLDGGAADGVAGGAARKGY